MEMNNQQVYGIQYWGEGYFDINSQGHVVVYPQQQNTQYPIDLYDLAQSLQQQGLELPVLVRFADILKDRIHHLILAFTTAQRLYHYQGQYTVVYPIKVNQQYHVLQSITEEKVGLEAGSKPELLAILALPNQLIICNGYKDRAYMRIALIGSQISHLFIVIEKISELEGLLAEAKLLGIRPQLGIRIRLSSTGSGRWQNSGGNKSKFGFSAVKVLEFIEFLKAHHYLDCLKLLHFHIGSQVANLQDIKIAIREATRHYAELYRLGINIRYLDVGGGLGVDYEGTRSRSHFSMNYTIEEYAQTIIKTVVELCNQQHLPHPHIITESGRAMTAHHSVLITNVVEVESALAIQNREYSPMNEYAISENYHHAQFNLAQIHDRYLHGQMNLTELAAAELAYMQLGQNIQRQLDMRIRTHRDILDELNELLADKVFCNFSLFQSLPDAWALAQIFPIMPLQRLNEIASRRAIIQDITCDSDGKICAYIDAQSIEKTLPLHEITIAENYYLGFFMVGAYQEILSDLHNLFGDVNCVNIKRNAAGVYEIANIIEGDNAADLLNYMDIKVEDLESAYRQKFQHYQPEQQIVYLNELRNALNAYTYLKNTF